MVGGFQTELKSYLPVEIKAAQVGVGSVNDLIPVRIQLAGKLPESSGFSDT
jgi:hypothetical protein